MAEQKIAEQNIYGTENEAEKEWIRAWMERWDMIESIIVHRPWDLEALERGDSRFGFRRTEMCFGSQIWASDVGFGPGKPWGRGGQTWASEGRCWPCWIFYIINQCDGMLIFLPWPIFEGVFHLKLQGFRQSQASCSFAQNLVKARILKKVCYLEVSNAGWQPPESKGLFLCWVLLTPRFRRLEGPETKDFFLLRVFSLQANQWYGIDV